MELSPNASVSLSPKEFLTDISHGAKAGGDNGVLTELLRQQTIEGDESSEWLSVFVEDCFSSSGNCFVAPVNHQEVVTKTSHSYPLGTLKPQLKNPCPVKKSSENSDNPTRKRRRKEKCLMVLKTQKNPSKFELVIDPYPPLLQQAHWLADSELIFPINQNSSGKEESSEKKEVDVMVKGRDFDSPSIDLYMEEPKTVKKKMLKSRRCSHCQTEKTPLWRQGPLGKGTLCNACGVRWIKSGRLFPEYRPAKSPTFVSRLHSNVLRKVMQMREARWSSSSCEQHI